MPLFLNTSDPGFGAAFAAFLTTRREDTPEVDDTVAAIIADVRARGDAAVIELTERFDRLSLTPDRLAFSAAEITAECAKVSATDRAALELAAERIRALITRTRCPATRAGPMRRARRSAGAGGRWRRRGCMCRGELRPTRPRC